MIVLKCNCMEMNSLLPWLANNTIKEEENTRVLMHFDKCPVCREDYALLLNIKESVTTITVDERQFAFFRIFKNIVNKIKPDIDHSHSLYQIRERLVHDIINNPVSVDIIGCLIDEVRKIIRNKVYDLKQELSPISSYFSLLNLMLRFYKIKS